MKVTLALIIVGAIATNILLNSDLISTTSAGYELPFAWENHESICYESAEAVPELPWFIDKSRQNYYEENGCFYEAYEICHAGIRGEPGIPFKYQRNGDCKTDENNLAYYLNYGIITGLFPLSYVAVRKVRSSQSRS